ncbi:hypothetical protein [Paenibacillus lautus]|uniref:hypothetical protein n=1 Tax=Paenibacillus lautus TaxID=1401 RepID=UPI003D272046
MIAKRLAERAEPLRITGVEVVMVTGAELMLFTRGFFLGETLPDRLEALSKPTVSRTGFG